jgi:bla regulator protein BlaR1
MHFLLFTDMFSGQATSAICWTLIHSLWQGMLFIILTSLVMILTKNSRPAFRYNLLSGLFLLFVLVSVFTFSFELKNSFSGEKLNTIAQRNMFSSPMNIHPIAVIQSEGTGRFFTSLTEFLSRHSSLIVMVWFIILCAKSIKIGSTLLYTRHIKVHKSLIPTDYWRNRVAELCGQLKIKKPVQLLESGIIKVPVVFGHLKPVIFMPLGLLANLPMGEIEAILIHEMAHIRRSDFLMNMLQNIAEILFFFNPAVLWISSLLRVERENCCDDIAIAQTNNKKQFIQALISFRQFSSYAHSNAVVAFPGSRNYFVARVRRLAENRNKTLDPVENLFLVLSLVVIGFSTLSFSQKKTGNLSATIRLTQAKTPLILSVSAGKNPGNKEITYSGIAEDTLPVKASVRAKPSSISGLAGNHFMIISDMTESQDNLNSKETIIAMAGDTVYRIIKMNNAITELYINNEIIRPNEISEYDDIIRKVNGELDRMKAEQEIRNKEQEARNADQLIRNKEQERRNKEQEIRNADQLVRNKDQETRNAEQLIRNKEQEARNADQLIRNKEQEKKDAEQLIRNSQQDQRNADQEIRNREQGERDAEQLVRNKEQEKRDAEQVIRNAEQERRNAELKKFIDELVKDNIIKDVKSLRSLILNKDEMIVNGEKQPAEVHEKFKNKYLESPDSQFSYQNY